MASPSSSAHPYSASLVRPYSEVHTSRTRATPRCSARSRRHSTLGARHSRSPAEADASLLTTALLADAHSSEA